MTSERSYYCRKNKALKNTSPTTFVHQGILAPWTGTGKLYYYIRISAKRFTRSHKNSLILLVRHFVYFVHEMVGTLSGINLKAKTSFRRLLLFLSGDTVLLALQACGASDPDYSAIKLPNPNEDSFGFGFAVWAIPDSNR